MPSEILGVVASPAVPAASAPAADSSSAGVSFHDVLSALNPLQYLPVVGTIYRAVTGDVIPEGLRRLGSMLVSGLMGGPIGLGINIVTTLAQEVTGIDPEKIVTDQINSPAVASASPAAPAVSVAPVVAEAPVVPEAPAVSEAPAAPPIESAATTGPWTAAQLAAYGVRSDPSGTLKLGAIEGADVLNAIQLAGLSRAAAVYAANQARV